VLSLISWMGTTGEGKQVALGVFHQCEGVWHIPSRQLADLLSGAGTIPACFSSLATMLGQRSWVFHVSTAYS